jgi:hypothetical protein
MRAGAAYADRAPFSAGFALHLARVVLAEPAISGNTDHPHALYLAAGSHYFYWVFNSWAYVYELRVDAI